MEGRLKVYLIIFDQYQGDGRLLSEWGAVWKSGREKGKGKREGEGGRSSTNLSKKYLQLC